MYHSPGSAYRASSRQVSHLAPVCKSSSLHQRWCMLYCIDCAPASSQHHHALKCIISQEIASSRPVDIFAQPAQEAKLQPWISAGSTRHGITMQTCITWQSCSCVPGLHFSYVDLAIQSACTCACTCPHLGPEHFCVPQQFLMFNDSGLWRA
jgi:hypothetical protein